MDSEFVAVKEAHGRPARTATDWTTFQLPKTCSQETPPWHEFKAPPSGLECTVILLIVLSLLRLLIFGGIGGVPGLMVNTLVQVAVLVAALSVGVSIYRYNRGPVAGQEEDGRDHRKLPGQWLPSYEGVAERIASGLVQERL